MHLPVYIRGQSTSVWVGAGICGQGISISMWDKGMGTGGAELEVGSGRGTEGWKAGALDTGCMGGSDLL